MRIPRMLFVTINHVTLTGNSGINNPTGAPVRRIGRRILGNTRFNTLQGLMIGRTTTIANMLIRAGVNPARIITQAGNILMTPGADL